MTSTGKIKESVCRKLRWRLSCSLPLPPSEAVNEPEACEGFEAADKEVPGFHACDLRDVMTVEDMSSSLRRVADNSGMLSQTNQIKHESIRNTLNPKPISPIGNPKP